MLVYSNEGKVIGKIIDDVLEKTVSGEKHMLRQPPSWGYDVEIIDKAAKLGVKFLKIYDTDSGKIYMSSLEKFKTYSFEQNRGHGPQRFLPINRWVVKTLNKQLQMFQKGGENEESMF